MERGLSGASSPLASRHREFTRSRIQDAAREVVARSGFDATVEEIAELSGVSPRTIYRHYRTHDELIAATVRDIYEACGLPRRREELDAWVRELPRSVDELDGWISDLAVTFHTRSAVIIGEAFWDIHGHRPSESAVLREVDSLRREFRLRGICHLVNLAWRVAGGVGQPPEELRLAFALLFSAFATRALSIDFDQTPARIGELTADIVKLLLKRAVETQRAAERAGDVLPEEFLG